jgi:predicted permease
VTVEDAALRLYRALARAFPQEFRVAYGADLADATEDAMRDAMLRGGRLRLVWLVPRLFLDLAVRVAVEQVRDSARDARYAVRLLTRAPGFTLAAVSCLAIGIGLTAAMFGQVQSTVLAPVPGVRDPHSLVRLQAPVPFDTYERMKADTTAFAAQAAFLGPVPLALSFDGGEARRHWGQLATPEYFDVLGVQAIVGQLFGSGKPTADASPVVVLGHRLWQTRFGADRSVVGRVVQINGQAVTVIGVAPAGFVGASPMTAAADLWIPTSTAIHIAPELRQLRDPRVTTVVVLGRLMPGVSEEQAELALDAVVRRQERLMGDPGRQSDEPRVRVLPGGRMFPIRTEDLPRAIGFPLVLVSLVLLMACGNVANLVLARNAARRREMALRLSLGASPGRILRQLLTESLLLAGVGAAAGALVALWLLSVFESARPFVPGYVQYDVPFDWAALAYSALLAAASTVLFGVVPGLRAGRGNIQGGLKPAPPSGLGARHGLGLRNVLIFQQVTVSVVLVLLTGFVVVGWNRAASVDVGFDPVNLYFMSVDPVRDGADPDRARDLVQRLRQRLVETPGVVAASVAQSVPLAMSGTEMVMSVRADLAAGSTALSATRVDRVGAGFFETIRTPVLSGRAFTREDERDDARVLVVNETMARRTWPGADPLGQTVSLGDQAWQIVGVVGDIRSAFPLTPTLPAIYQPVTPAAFALPTRDGVTLTVRTLPGFDVPTVLTREARTLDPNLSVSVRPLSEEVEQALFLARTATVLYGGMGVLGLILASVGLAGVTAYAVTRRTREIGIRMALGARRADVLWLVLREGAAIAAAGTVVGVAGALGLTYALSSVVEALAETTRTSMADPILLIGGPALLMLFALLACYLPARRSTRIDPKTALRAE